MYSVAGFQKRCVFATQICLAEYVYECVLFSVFSLVGVKCVSATLN